MTSYYRGDLGIPEMGVVGRELWRQSGLGPDDMDTAVLYDHFTPYVLMQLEELGFCGRGEAPGFIAGGAIELGGRLPLNTHGGQLGEAYIHGMNGIAEAVRPAARPDRSGPRVRSWPATSTCTRRTRSRAASRRWCRSCARTG
jgi:acetyl-CoA acetyltransferase